MSFTKRQKKRDLDKIAQTIPASFKTIPIHLVDLPDNSADPILDAITVSEEYRQNQEKTEVGSSAQLLTVQYASPVEEIAGHRTERVNKTQLTSTQKETAPGDTLSDMEVKKERTERGSSDEQNLTAQRVTGVENIQLAPTQQSYTDEASHKPIPTNSEETTLHDSAKLEEGGGAIVSRKRVAASDSDSTRSRKSTTTQRELLDSPTSFSPSFVGSDMQPSNNKDKLNEMLERHTQEVTHKIMERLDSMERQTTEKLDSIFVRIKGLEGQLAIATGNEDRHSDRYAPVAAAIAKSSKGLPCTIHPAPSQVVGIRDQFIERLNKALSEENYKLDDDPDGPAVAFAVNGSRLESDLKRDLKSVPSRSRTMLVVIKPTMIPQYKPERVKPANLGFPWVEEAVVILVDINNTELHVCDTNTNAVKALIGFIKKKSLPTKEFTDL